MYQVKSITKIKHVDLELNFLVDEIIAVLINKICLKGNTKGETNNSNNL